MELSGTTSDEERLRSGLAALFRVAIEDLDGRFPQQPADWDSMEVLATIALLDQLHGVTVPTDELVRCRSAGELATLARRAAGREG
ncbi:MAG TPA: hypothetical protein VGS57_14445 [Thermoanaerobaculia bacterium]|jgi:acyl carrier protein|nr:hypothetical protein [Thermoanaerobaculia bacterium]